MPTGVSSMSGPTGCDSPATGFEPSYQEQDQSIEWAPVAPSVHLPGARLALADDELRRVGDRVGDTSHRPIGRSADRADERTVGSIVDAFSRRIVGGRVASTRRPIWSSLDVTVGEAAARLAEFHDTCGDKYPAVKGLWANAWAEFVPFLVYSP